MPSLEEKVASIVLSRFRELPKKSKPRSFPDGSREWIPMSGLVLVRDAHTDLEELTCVSLATGSKCIPTSSLPKCEGTVLHDCHAEVLALRGLNYFLLSEVYLSLQNRPKYYVSLFVQKRGREITIQASKDEASYQPYEIRPEVSIWMFASEAPCGDASMELLIGEMGQNCEPWQTLTDPRTVLNGRGYFSNLGVVRRKPARGDAEVTMSKSCTDKLTVKQVTSVLSFPTSLIIAPTKNAFLNTLVVPAQKYSDIGFQRAFGPRGRLARLDAHALSNIGVEFRPFDMKTIPSDFEQFPFTKPDARQPSTKIGNVSAMYVWGLTGRENFGETLIGGVKQGHKQFSTEKGKSSSVCRKKLWQLVRDIAQLLSDEQDRLPSYVLSPLVAGACSNTYRDFKAGPLGNDRRKAKRIVTKTLEGWIKNEGDEDWRM